MKFLSRLMAIVALALAATTFVAPIPALAQVSGVVYTTPAQARTYAATVVGLAPAASATDLITISGVAGHQVRILRIECSGVSTANAASLLQIVKRSTLDTGGTSATMTSVRLNSLNPVSLAPVKSYTANPTLGTSIGVVDAGYIVTNTLASATIINGVLTFDFSNQFLIINEATVQYALNANGVSFSAGTSLACSVLWSEI